MACERRILGDRRKGGTRRDGATLLPADRGDGWSSARAAQSRGSFLRVSSLSSVGHLLHDVLYHRRICLYFLSFHSSHLFCVFIIMAGIRPPVLDAALRSCTRVRRAPALRNAPFSKRSPAVQRRWISDSGGRPPVPPGGGVGKNTVVAPKTRLAVGVVFIGALIYSMVQGPRVNIHILDHWLTMSPPGDR